MLVTQRGLLELLCGIAVLEGNLHKYSLLIFPFLMSIFLCIYYMHNVPSGFDVKSFLRQYIYIHVQDC